jgi:hypothetical protein
MGAARGPPAVLGFRTASGLHRVREHGQPETGRSAAAGQGSIGPDRTTRIALGGLGRFAGCGILPDGVPVPHEWLFPRTAAAVHYGGAGTTAASLRAGVPSVVTPFFGDQPFWGERIHALGVGPRPIPRRRLTAERLAAAIQAAVSDTGMRERAARLGRRIRAEDGVARAVEIWNAVPD